MRHTRGTPPSNDLNIYDDAIMLIAPTAYTGIIHDYVNERFGDFLIPADPGIVEAATRQAGPVETLAGHVVAGADWEDGESAEAPAEFTAARIVMATSGGPLWVASHRDGLSYKLSRALDGAS